MALGQARSVALDGVRGVLVEVEADLTAGLAKTTLVGAADAVLGEARDRVRAAVINSGEPWPADRITIGLSPAGVHKRGSAFDVAIAVAIVSAAGRIPPGATTGTVLLGELGLDGRVRTFRGVLPSVIAAEAAGASRVVVPQPAVGEASLVPGIEVVGVCSLRHLLAVLRGQVGADQADADPVAETPGSVPRPGVCGGPDAALADPRPGWEPRGGGNSLGVRLGGCDGLVPDLADVRGQLAARTALEIAAAGGHNLLLCGAPGAGKTMLAERLPGLLGRLDTAAALEVSAIHSVAGTLHPDHPLIDRPPFCAPHHSASLPAMVGGGSSQVRPGAVSLAHRGVLFLDECPEFSRPVLDSLRQPIESGEVIIARAAGTARFPARFQLVLAANPCPCGMAGIAGRSCTCTVSQRRRYLSRISGPLLDRVDLRVDVTPLPRAELLGALPEAEGTAAVAARVAAARERARRRFVNTPWRTNAEVPGPELRSRWRPKPDALISVEREMDLGRLTARGLDRVLRVSWSVADLAGVDRPRRHEVDTALFFRTGATLLGDAS